MNKLEQLLALRAKMKAETVTTYEIVKWSDCGEEAVVKSSKGKEVKWTAKWLEEKLADGSAKADAKGLITFEATKKVYVYS
jgi:hypothetical protein